ncbi:unnamed protein product, partial [marine sediment metagenome]
VCPTKLDFFTDSGIDSLKVETISTDSSVKMWRWDNESFLGVNYIGGETNAKINLIDGVLSQQYSTYEVNRYVLPELGDNGGFEYEVVLKIIPASNVLSFSIDMDNLDFYYQPPLNEVETPPPGGGVNATHVWDDNGTIITHRPIDVVGSYAIYHDSKRDNKFKTGKAFHIYRPLLIDAEGNEAWADLNIEDGVLTITCPPEFLDSAKYPVIVDPLFGYDTMGVNTLYSTFDYIIGSWFTCPEAGTANSITFYLVLRSEDDGPQKLGIYKKSDGSFIGGTAEVSSQTPDSW